MDGIEALRARYEAELMRIDGVVGVGTATDADGNPRLRILTSEPADAVLARIPEEIHDRCVVMYVGDVEAQ